MSCNQSNKSCSECPFSKTSPPGGLGGSLITAYLGQIKGPFFLPCHMPSNYKGNDTEIAPEVMQCAGAAIFRRKIGVASKMPDPLLKLETDDSNVFDSIEEFIEHHVGDASDEIKEALVEGYKNGFWTEMALREAVAKGKPIQSAKEAQKSYENR